MKNESFKKAYNVICKIITILFALIPIGMGFDIDFSTKNYEKAFVIIDRMFKGNFNISLTKETIIPLVVFLLPAIWSLIVTLTTTVFFEKKLAAFIVISIIMTAIFVALNGYLQNKVFLAFTSEFRYFLVFYLCNPSSSSISSVGSCDGYGNNDGCAYGGCY